MNQRFYALLVLMMCTVSWAIGQVTVTDADLPSTADAVTTWTKDNVYLLDGYVFVKPGTTLEIEAGTVIKGVASPTTGSAASALIVARGAKIMAEGTADEPIIFTAELDDVSNPSDLDKTRKGLWGGLIVLGAAPVGVDGDVSNVEGIPSTLASAEYGGTDPEDNSGVIKYISIRHGGSKLEANNEINGLTLAGVGSGTEIDYVEVFANLDDGIEWFGGTVSVKHAVVAFCGDDSFDYDQSWDGKGQFWFSLQDDLSNRAGEWDGSEKADLTPKVIPVISNATLIGAGTTSQNEDGNDALRIRDDAAVNLHNSIITSFAGRSYVLDNDAEPGSSDTYNRFLAGDVVFNRNIHWEFGAGTMLADIVSTDGGDDNLLITSLVDNGNSLEDPALGGISRTADGNLDPRLNAGSPGLTNAFLIDDEFFDPVSYRGAFNNTNNWAESWTALDEYGFFGDLATPVAGDIITLRDGDINANESITLMAANTYLLDGYVFVEEGAVLTIEAGTVIKGLASPSTGDKSSALIIARGGKIIADGRADAPIIMTAEFDDVTNPDDLDKTRKGLWGGLILLGNAPVGVDGDESNIEGIPSTEGRALYGGDDPEDNSGILRYVSIRHGGDKLEANNEINGLTLGGVGSGTEIDYVEVYANLDDGIEWFGGTVSVKHAVVSYCGDDSFDYDQSWDGKGQFWFTIQDDLSNRAGEWDGSEKADLTPKVIPVISNVTFIGAGATSQNEDGNDALRIRDDAAVNLHNSIITSFAGRSYVLDNDADPGSSDTYNRFLAGEVVFNRNIHWDFGAGSALADIVSTDGGDDNLLITSLTDNGNSLEDPLLGGISRTADGGLDPRPSDGSPALSGAFLIDDDFFDPVPYRGAFSNSDNWAEGWTALSFGDLATPAADNIVVIQDDDIEAGQELTLTADNTYLLDGYVFVEAGAVLTIDPGTVIKGAASPSTGDKSSALIIARGGKIIADATAEFPIIMTAELDDVNDPDDLDGSRKGLWGGLIVLGNAPVGVDGDVSNVEGIPSTEGRAAYGGDDPEDDSGIIKYVSIRHGGDKLEANNEINGLTLAGVGSGTEIDYVEVFANLDDGIEFFGGTVSVKHAVVSFCGDDSYDYDQSWDGKGQFWFSLQDELSNRAGEWDGSEKADLTPKVIPVISHATFIGAGATSQNEDGNDALRIRDDAAVNLHNSIITSFAGRSYVLDNDADPGSSDTYNRFLAGDVVFNRNIHWEFGAGTALADIVSTDGGDDNLLITSLTDNGNSLEDPVLGGISRSTDGGLDPRPSDGSPALGGAFIIGDDYFDPVPYRGAFANGSNWALGWTALDANGYFGDLATPASEQLEVLQDDDIQAGQTVTLTADKTYILDGYVFVEDGAVLIINPGTVIKGAASPSTGDQSSALIIARGGKIIADARADAPIIMTAESDDVNDPDDLGKERKGLWGGLIILGKAPVGVDGDESNIEGIPSTEGRATYGGTEPMDSSGVIRYVSIRHGGDKLEANNEINGLTLGGVGSKTVIDYVEVFANLDDGIEWFGGTVSVNHAAVSFCGDDSFDYDQSWDGNGQFWFSIQDELSNRAGEWDGSEKADLTPKVIPAIYNATFIGAGATSENEDGNDALRIRDDAAVNLHNSLLIGFANRAIVIDNDAEMGGSDSYNRFLDGDIVFNNNYFFDFGAGETLADIITTDGGDDAGFITALEGLGNTIADPVLGGISRIADGGLDPRPSATSPLLFAANWIEGDTIPSLTPYVGAFGNAENDNWAEGWTALSDNGFFGDLAMTTSTSELGQNIRGVKVGVPYPNPAMNMANVDFEVPGTTTVQLSVFDMGGRMVQSNNIGLFNRGEYVTTIDVTRLQTGLYIVAMDTDFGRVVQKFNVLNNKN